MKMSYIGEIEYKYLFLCKIMHDMHFHALNVVVQRIVFLAKFKFRTLTSVIKFCLIFAIHLDVLFISFVFFRFLP